MTASVMPRRAASRLQTMFRNRAALIGGVIIAIASVVALVAPFLAPHDPDALVGGALLPPGSDGHLLGTDDLGRDLLSRLMYGARVSLMVGLLVASISTLCGVAIGACAGYSKGRVDSLLMRLTEAFQMMPVFLVALVVVAMVGTGLGKLIVVLGLLSWPRTARMVRGQFLSLREREFVSAAKCLGVSGARIVVSEILPNALPPAIAVASLDIGRAILLEAGLSFLGLGDPSVVSWGAVLRNADRFLQQAWWLSVFPGLVIFLIVLSFNLLSDGVSDALNPKLRSR